MTNEIRVQIDTIQTREDLTNFVKRLSQYIEAGLLRWENSNIAIYFRSYVRLDQRYGWIL